jgi:uncharacterized protein
MKLAVNYSPATAELYRTGRIQLDCFKCPPWPDMLAEAAPLAPIAIHFELRAGSGNLHQTHWEEIETFLAHTNTPYVNVHLAAFTTDFPGMAADTTDPLDAERILEVFIRDTNAVIQHFGAERVIAENVIYYGSQQNYLRPASDPALIRQVIQETGCGFLFDICHARISAPAFGMDEYDYMRALPLDRMCELHFTGIHEINGSLQDHLSALPADWPPLDWVLSLICRGQCTAPWLLAFEYGGVGNFFGANTDPAVLAEQVPLLWQRVHPDPHQAD